MLRKIIAVSLASLLLAACGGDEPTEDESGLANPASVYCQEQGGTVDMRESDGGTYGVCVFPDGSECDEWAFYDDACAPGIGEDQAGLANPASVFCIEQGGTLEMREGEGGTAGFCRFLDGSECEEWAFFRGECRAGG
ncbi:MAG: DUF333 domain-containing protein [Acidimicrobiia bacterium]|nr:DUF333 domain-containing protein [Acidimicrobiia bacterium]